MVSYNDLISNSYLPTKEDEIERIKAQGEAQRKAYDTELNKAKGRMGLGTVISGIGILPFAITKNPIAASGIGGALYEFGQGLVEGDKAPELLARTGTGAIVGALAGKALPALAKSKAGQAIGNQASKLFDYLANTKAGQKVAEIAPKVEDVLMTDIKAFNPFKQTQTAYHGSPYDFNKFSNEAIGTGEGAQAHGYGHYAAKSKDIADTRYANMAYEGAGLSSETKGLMRYGNLDDVKNELKNKIDYYHKIKDELNPSQKKWWEEQNKKIERDLKILEENNISKQLYKLSIPKDDVMLREGATLAEQPKVVQQALNELYPNYIPNDTPMSGLFMRELFANQGIKRTKDEIRKAISDKLYSKGVKGISYNGGIDGEARVIFNPDDIEIVRKYYNQPSLYEQITGKPLNTGAVSTNLYDLMTKEEKIQNLWDKRKVWGTPFQKASGNPELAIQVLKEQQRGFVPNADNNGVDFVWGKYIPPAKPNKKGGGYGLAHIEGRRFEDGYNGTKFLDEIPDLIMNGNKYLKPKHNDRYYIGDGQKESIIRTDYNGNPWHWLNSTYYLDK